MHFPYLRDGLFVLYDTEREIEWVAASMFFIEAKRFTGVAVSEILPSLLDFAKRGGDCPAIVQIKFGGLALTWTWIVAPPEAMAGLKFVLLTKSVYTVSIHGAFSTLSFLPGFVRLGVHEAVKVCVPLGKQKTWCGVDSMRW